MPGKSEKARIYKEVMLAAGKTVVVASSQTTTKWTRHWRRGRFLDVAEDLKPMGGHEIDKVWYDETRDI